MEVIRMTSKTHVVEGPNTPVGESLLRGIRSAWPDRFGKGDDDVSITTGEQTTKEVGRTEPIK